MGDVVAFRRLREPWQKARCLFTRAGICEASIEASCRCLGTTETPELHALQYAQWFTDLSDPDLIAFAKTGAPPSLDEAGC